MKSNPVVGILGTNGSVSRALPPTGRSMEMAGWNTGNLIYQFAAHNYVTSPKVTFAIGSSNEFEKIRNSIDILHIPAANQLNPNFDLRSWAQLIEYMDKPLFIAGLGIQCELSDDEIVLSEGTIAFINALKRYAPKIGVRGASTAAVLKRYGVDTAVVTGCPSNFLNPDVSGSSLAGQITKAKSLTNLRVDYFPGTISHHLDIESKLRSLVAKHDFRYVLQTNELLFKYVDGVRDDPQVSQYINWEHMRLTPNSSRSDYENIYAERTDYYFSAPGWLDSMLRRDLGIGMRMHGVVASIQGGSAGVCIVADGRIQELVSTMGYPSLSLDDARNANSLHELLEAVSFDPIQFDVKRRHLANTYREIARESGVPVAVGIF